MTSFYEKAESRIRIDVPGMSVGGFAESSLAAFDTAPIDRIRLSREFENRLAQLVEGIVASRSRAGQYFRVARRFTAAARRARGTSDQPAFAAHVYEADQAHRQARKCLSYAKLCERRVECLKAIGSFSLQGRSLTAASPSSATEMRRPMEGV